MNNDGQSLQTVIRLLYSRRHNKLDLAVLGAIERIGDPPWRGCRLGKIAVHCRNELALR